MTSGMSVNPNHATGMVPGCNMGGNLPTLAALPHMGGGTSTLPIDTGEKRDLDQAIATDVLNEASIQPLLDRKGVDTAKKLKNRIASIDSRIR